MARRAQASHPVQRPAGAAIAAPAPAREQTLGTVGIEEAARQVGVSPSTIRAWERQGLVLPLRTAGGVRRYRPGDVGRLRAIRAWRTVDGLNAAAIRQLHGASDGAGAAMAGRHVMAGGRQVPAAAASNVGAAGRGGSDGDGAGTSRTDAAPREAGSAGRLDASGANGSVDGPGIAERLRDVRLARRLTLREAAERSGLSASFVSAVERGISGASVSALRRLLDAYGTTLAELLDGSGDGAAPRLVAASDRHAAEAGTGVRIENLTRASGLLEPQLFILAPGASSNGSYSHPGEEFMYVLDGTLGVWLETAGESYVLGPGDSLTFPSSLEHRFEALGRAETRVIWVNTPPTF